MDVTQEMHQSWLCSQMGNRGPERGRDLAKVTQHFSILMETITQVSDSCLGSSPLSPGLEQMSLDGGPITPGPGHQLF